MKVTEVVFRGPFALHSEYPVVNISHTFKNKVAGLLPRYPTELQCVL